MLLCRFALLITFLTFSVGAKAQHSATATAPKSPSGKPPQKPGKPVSQETVAAPEALYGRWKLTRTNGGIAGRTNAPTEAMYLAFKRDGTVTETPAGKPPITTRFRVTSVNSIFGGKKQQLQYVFDAKQPIYPHGNGQVITLLNAQKLVLADNHPDGFSFTYERAP